MHGRNNDGRKFELHAFFAVGYIEDAVTAEPHEPVQSEPLDHLLRNPQFALGNVPWLVLMAKDKFGGSSNLSYCQIWYGHGGE
jgi:hypothetical protein